MTASIKKGPDEKISGKTLVGMPPVKPSLVGEGKKPFVTPNPEVALIPEAEKVSASEAVDAVGQDEAAKPLTEAAPAGDVHKEYIGFFEKIDEKTATADFDSLYYDEEKEKPDGKISIEDIRFNPNLFSSKEEKEANANGKISTVERRALLKVESARRLKLYTSTDGDWFNINYERLGMDKHGMAHEIYVGLGDILLDPDIQAIWVERKNKKTGELESFKAVRGYDRSRPCFVDSEGKYVATRTGDRFRIITNNADKPDDAGYQKWFDDDIKSREGGKSLFIKKSVMYKAEKAVTMKDKVELSHNYMKDGKEKTFSIDKGTIEAAMGECKTSVKDFSEVNERKNFRKLLDFVALKVGVPAEMIFTVGFHESRCKFPGSIGDSGRAKGMGQFHVDAWSTAKGSPIFSEVMSQVITEDPATTGRGCNILADILGTAIMLKRGAETFDFDISHNTPKSYLEEQITAPDGRKMPRMAWLRSFYHVPSYARDYAKIIKAGSIDKGLTPKYKERFLAKSKPWFDENYPRYVKYATNASGVLAVSESTFA